MYQNTPDLGRKALDGVEHPVRDLLKFAATDAFYVFKDDFDYGFNEQVWGTTVDGGGSGTPFEDADDINGWIVGDPGRFDNAAVRLYSRKQIWSPRRRPVLTSRMALANVNSMKFEFGFSSFARPDDMADVDGCVLVKDTPTSQVGANNYAVVVYDTDDDTSVDLVGQANNTTAKGVRSGGPTVGFEFTLMVAVNEHGGVVSWVNGVRAGLIQLAPLDADATHGTQSPAQDIRHGVSSTFGIWLFGQNRASSVSNHALFVDYIQGWQERSAL